MNQTNMTVLIREKLTQSFAPQALDVHDDSARHAGHAGVAGHAKQGGGTHFNVRIVSSAFAGLGKVARHRAVYAALADEMKTQIHALALETLTPEETV